MSDPKQRTVAKINARAEDIEAFAGRLKSFLDSRIKKILAGVRAGELTALETAQVLGGIVEQLRAAGLDDYLTELDKLYGKELRNIGETLKAYKPRKRAFKVLTDADLQLTATLIEFDAAAVENKILAAADDMRSTIMRAVVSGETPDIDAIREELGNKVASNVATELRTGLSGFNQTVINKKTEELGIELFLYVGPDDDAIRPFCEEHVEQVYTRAEIDAMDNGQDLPVSVYGGGYNCRHQWAPIDEETAREEYGWNGN